MNSTTPINEHHQRIVQWLNRRQLKQALDDMSTFVKDIPEWDLHTQFDEVQTAYQYMLQYFRQNISDPQRLRLYNELIQKTFVLNDRLRMSQLERAASTLFYSTLREQKQNPRTLADYQLIFESFTEDIAMADLMGGQQVHEEKKRLRRQHEEIQNAFFCKVWTSPLWDAAWNEAAHRFLQSMLVPANDLALLVSAVTLGASEVFDVQKLMFLFDAYQHEDNLINQRALFGIVLLCILHEERIHMEPEVKARLKLWDEDPRFHRDFIHLQIALLRTRETQKANRKMREEIIPEVMKNHSTNIKLTDVDEESYLNDKNPEWKKWEENSELTHKIQEMGNMQMEGIDVYMGTFAQLKSFPFFRNLCNWFYPFDAQHTAVLQVFPEEEQKKNFIVRSVLHSGYFCNSDKYSFCLTAQSIPPQQREMFSMNLGEQAEIPKELNGDPHTGEIIIRQYVQDLYRFYKVHPRRHEFVDIFEKIDLLLHHCSLLHPLSQQPEYTTQVAEYLFHKEYYAEALPLFRSLVAHPDGTDAEYFQKLGFCYQKEKAYGPAIEAYRRADTLKADTLWTIRHMAQCHRLLKDTAAAVEHYRKALEIAPDNLAILQQTGECEMELHEHEQALGRFFKVEYLNPRSLRAWRAIAWCSFLCGKLEQAEKYYRKLLDEPEPEATDYLNAGHTAWAKHDIPRAAELYLSGSQRLAQTEAFIELLLNDRMELELHGIPSDDIPLMADLIRYGQP